MSTLLLRKEYWLEIKEWVKDDFHGILKFQDENDAYNKYHDLALDGYTCRLIRVDMTPIQQSCMWDG